MILHKLSIVNYKNIAEAQLEFCPKINCLVGLNGMGKTNVLDAIYYLSFCKSALNAIDSQIVKHDAELMVLQGNYTDEAGKPLDIYCGLKKGRRKVFKRNAKEYRKLSEHIGLIPLVLVSPADQELILGGSDQRRRFLDMVISQYDSNYLYEENRYRKALQQRNALLKREDALTDTDYLSVYEMVMAEAGKYVFEARQAFVDSFVPIFGRLYSCLGQGETVSLSYQSNVQPDQLALQLEQSRVKDQIVGFSLQGVHRDDLQMDLDTYPIKREGSQGQAKTYLTALKMAQFEYLKDKTGHLPLLLLDDIFDKLDASRVEHILQLVGQDNFGQIFITDTDKNFLSHMISTTGIDYRIFEVCEGEIKDEVQ